MDKGVELIHYLHIQPSRSIELSLRDLAERLGIKEASELDVAIKCNQELKRLNLSCSPPIKEGSFDQVRLISANFDSSLDEVKSDIKMHENQELEFKSTYLYNIKQGMAQPDRPISELDSKTIEFEVYKTICGFLNQEGGKLYIGIEDDGTIYGVENDFKCLGDDGDYDKWELKLRNAVRTRFKDGKKIANYIQIKNLELEGKTVVQVIVTPKKEESFVLNNNGEFEFRMRQGNETPKYTIDELPSLVLRRRNIK